MVALIQRVKSSQVSVGGKVAGQIGRGANILLGVSQDDEISIVPKFVDKIINLRIFPDEEGKMNKSILDSQGEILLISQFTLIADCRKGRRPSFARAASAEKAKKIYEEIIKLIKAAGIKVATGQFGSYMQVDIVND